MPDISHLSQQLIDQIASYGSCAVAFSGGVDSAVVAKAAQLALADRAVAVTGISASLADEERQLARQLAADIGIRHVELPTGELAKPGYFANGPDRCFHCKTELYSRLAAQLDEMGVQVIVNGTNQDDLGDYRPGLEAARDHSVRSPLVECGIDKAVVRQLASHWSLAVADKPAAPCLSSRIAYGQEVTPARLKMVERAEQLVHQLQLPNVRVRYHAGDLARIEVPAAAIERLADPDVRTELVEQLRAVGFRFVTLDLEGLRSGSLNDLIPVEQLKRFS